MISTYCQNYAPKSEPEKGTLVLGKEVSFEKSSSIPHWVSHTQNAEPKNPPRPQ